MFESEVVGGGSSNSSESKRMARDGHGLFETMDMSKTDLERAPTKRQIPSDIKLGIFIKFVHLKLPWALN